MDAPGASRSSHPTHCMTVAPRTQSEHKGIQTTQWACLLQQRQEAHEERDGRGCTDPDVRLLHRHKLDARVTDKASTLQAPRAMDPSMSLSGPIAGVATYWTSVHFSGYV